MSRVKNKNTKPEIIVRSIVHRLGYRFRKNNLNLQGRPDIVLTRHRKVIFVHGCFWHAIDNARERRGRQQTRRFGPKNLMQTLYVTSIIIKYSNP
jgi:DNA mismatch endonuclease (patch repair protein)